MKKKMYNDEELLRDKMLRHEFPANEQAWEQMEGLLNGTPTLPDLAPVPLPAATASVTLQSALTWMAGLGLASLLAMLVTSQQPQSPQATEQTSPLPKHQEKTLQPHNAGQSAANTQLLAPASGPTQPGQPGTSEVSASRVFLEKKAESRSFFSKSGTVDSKAVSALVLSAEQKPVPRPVAHSSISGGETLGAYDAASSPVRLPGGPAAPSPTREDASDQPEQAEQATGSPPPSPALPTPLSTLPKTELLALHIVRTLRMPKVAVPTAPPTFRERRFQVGVALGGQWAIVDRSVNQVDLVPTFGVSFNGKIAPRWWAETGLMWRTVSGYDLSATWDASGIGANGLSGSWAARVGTSKIAFLEMPLLAKYALRNGDQRLMAGARLARLSPRTDNKSYTSVLNSYAPNKGFFPEIGDGIRRYDLALTVGVEARIFHNLWADIRHTQGLYDLTYDSFFGNTNVDRTAETQLTLRYYFWSF